jgi:hypothetical protein
VPYPQRSAPTASPTGPDALAVGWAVSSVGTTAQSHKRIVKLGGIGRKLTAYVGGVRDVRALDRWMNRSELYGDAKQRLRFAFQLVRMLAKREDPTVIQSWLTGLNPELGDRVPLRLMRENDLEKVAPERSRASFPRWRLGANS